ncbi:UNVERIFIED_ORG: hypothetical protein J2791_004542, partial [Burkholderia contaminans]|nr:hypothetical protein [Burkholderia contaminans]
SQRRGHASNHQLPEDLAHRALSLIRERYADFGPTLACEKLRESHGIRLAKETVRKLMTDAGLWIPRSQRPPKPSLAVSRSELRTSIRRCPPWQVHHGGLCD